MSTLRRSPRLSILNALTLTHLNDNVEKKIAATAHDQDQSNCVRKNNGKRKERDNNESNGTKRLSVIGPEGANVACSIEKMGSKEVEEARPVMISEASAVVLVKEKVDCWSVYNHVMNSVAELSNFLHQNPISEENSLKEARVALMLKTKAEVELKEATYREQSALNEMAELRAELGNEKEETRMAKFMKRKAEDELKDIISKEQSTLKEMAELRTALEYGKYETMLANMMKTKADVELKDAICREKSILEDMAALRTALEYEINEARLANIMKMKVEAELKDTISMEQSMFQEMTKLRTALYNEKKETRMANKMKTKAEDELKEATSREQFLSRDKNLLTAALKIRKEGTSRFNKTQETLETISTQTMNSLVKLKDERIKELESQLQKKIANAVEKDIKEAVVAEYKGSESFKEDMERFLDRYITSAEFKKTILKDAKRYYRRGFALCRAQMRNRGNLPQDFDYSFLNSLADKYGNLHEFWPEGAVDRCSDAESSEDETNE